MIRYYCEKWKAAINIIVLGFISIILLFVFYISKIYFFVPVILILILILTTLEAYYLFKYSFRKITIPFFAGVLILEYQGWLGSKVVSSELKPMIVSLHFYFAIALVGCLIYSWFHLKWKNSESFRLRVGESSENFRMWNVILFILSLLQVLSGTKVRETLEILFPSRPDSLVINLYLNTINSVEIHKYAGFFFSLSCVLFFYYFRKKFSQKSIPFKTVWILVIVTILQHISGSILYYLAFPSLIQAVHLLFSTILFGILFFLVLVSFMLKEVGFAEKRERFGFRFGMHLV